MTDIVDEETFGELLSVVERFVREQLIPHERQVEDEDDIPPAIVRQMQEMGLFGISIPQGYGGLGLSMQQEVRLIEALCYASIVFRSLIGTNVGIGSQGLIIDGTEEQKQAYLPKLASGEIIASFALTEPDVGSDAASVRATGRRDGDDFILNGTKRYITNGTRAGLFTVMVRTDPNIAGARGVSAFVVPADTPGISLGKHDHKMGQRGTRTCDVIFENARVPASAIIGGPANEGKGFYTAMKVLSRGRIHLSAVACGTAQRMLDEATDYAIDRRQFGVPIAEHQLIQGLLANARTELAAAKALVRQTAAAFDAGQDVSMDAASCKYFSSEMAGRVADSAVQIHGGAGYMAEYPIERLYRDVRLLRIYEGTSQIQQIIIARALVKERQGRR